MDIEGRQQLLAEAIEIIRFSDIELGEEVPKKEVDPLKEKAVKLLENLNKELVEFSPKLDVYPLDAGGLSPEIEEALLPEIEKKMQEQDFYRVDIPITLKSAPDWAFSSLVCNVAFCPDEDDRKQVHLLPTIHDIFPADEWQEIFSLQDFLTLGLDEKFGFRAEVEKIEGKWQQLGGEAQAKLAVRGEGGMKLAFGPFSYRIRKARIKSQGRGNVQVFWEFDGAEYVNEQDVKLGLILMVPKSRNRPVDAVGALQARHDFQVWSADLLHFKQFFRGAIQQLLEGGVPINSSQAWKEITRVG